MKLRAVFLYGF